MIEASRYERARSAAEAVSLHASCEGSRFLAGGTTLIDLMKEGVETPQLLVDIGRLEELRAVREDPAGGLEIGALVRNSDLACHPAIRARYPAVAQALQAGASVALRNMATTAGNLLQATRCPCFRDRADPCNRRIPGSGCAAIAGADRSHAVLGVSDHCIATHPSDLAVALVALRAVVHVLGPGGTRRTFALEDLHLPPGATPAHETTLGRSELIVAVTLPALKLAGGSHYLKVRDRASYEFALASAAVGLDCADGRIGDAAVALGGVATVPWRSAEAEGVLVGRKADRAAFLAAAEAALAGARPGRLNAFKIGLAKATLVRALETVAATRAS